MTFRFAGAFCAVALLASPVVAWAQTNQGPIEQPHSSATSSEQPGKAHPEDTPLSATPTDTPTARTTPTPDRSPNSTARD